jgi:hypothetical protein
MATEPELRALIAADRLKARRASEVSDTRLRGPHRAKLVP